jgi:hypothetical protein
MSIAQHSASDEPPAIAAREEPRRAFPEALVLGLVLLAVAAVQGGSLTKLFFADDYFFLEQVRGRSLFAALAAPDPLGNFFRPVSRQLYFWTLSRLGGESPVPFHAANLLLFLSSLAVLYLLARRFAGVGAALTATAFVGFHYAADVPLRWASGSQDLLALFLGLSAIYLQCTRRFVPAAIALALGLLSKESVAGAALIALVASHRPGTSWRETTRRSAGLIGVTAVWAVWWILSSSQRAATGQALSLEPSGPFGALAHLLQVSLGLEFRPGGDMIGHWTVPAALVGGIAGAIFWLGRERIGGVEDEPRRWLLRVGIIWSLLGALPVALVAPIWSAYFYLWALAGVGLVVAGLTSRLAPEHRGGVVAALVLLSAQARALDEFSPSRGAWAWQSHVNRHYVDRALETTEAYLRQLRSAHPTLPAHGTVFFANVPASTGWQAGNGPLLRWAYRDSSLRSYFLTEFTRERAARGPVLFFAVEGDSLREKTNDPLLLPSFAFSMLLAEKPRAALEALDLAIVRAPEDQMLRYWRAWARWAGADSAGARADFERVGMRGGQSPSADTDPRMGSTRADTTARIERLKSLRAEAALSPWVHARLAALLLASPASKQEGALEAYAYRVLSPGEPDAWRKWASAQLAFEQYGPALESLERYVALAGARGSNDGEARRVIESLRRLTAGDLAHAAVRGGS